MTFIFIIQILTKNKNNRNQKSLKINQKSMREIDIRRAKRR
jgi:hypothetical protein